MDDKKRKTLAKFGLWCGVIMIVCGIIITVVSAMDVEVRPLWRIISGIFFIALGTLYWITNSRVLNK